MHTAAGVLTCVLGCALASGQPPSFDLKTTPVQGRAYRAVAADFDHDAKLDLALLVADGMNNTLQIFLGQGDGTFRHIQTFSLTGDSFAIASGDLNGDGRVDLVLESVIMNASNGRRIPALTIFLGRADGAFQVSDQPVPLPVFDISKSLVAPLNIGDVNGDGKLDIVLGPHYAEDTVPNHSEITVLAGNGDATFGAAIENLTNISVYILGIGDAVLADVTNDGMSDLIVTYEQRGGEGGIDVYSGQSNGTMVRSFTGPFLYNCTSEPRPGPVTADFNGDGLLDFASNLCQGLQVILQKPGYLAESGAVGIPQAYRANAGVAAGDVDGDGKLDIVYAQRDQVVIVPGDGLGGFNTPVPIDLRPLLNSPASPNPVKTADINGDGMVDIIVLTDQGITAMMNAGFHPAGRTVRRRQ